jgi:indolepyruvate decarboxylase
MEIGRALLSALKDHGAEGIFGIPGDFALPFFKVIEDSGILPLYTLSHEPALGFAADAAARYNSSLGVVAVTYGAGAFNVLNSMAGAYAERSPVVVISGAPGRAERASGMLVHHQAKTLDSQFHVFHEIAGAGTRLEDPETAPEEIARVLRAALEQSLPVYLELPRDLVTAPCDAVKRLEPTEVAKAPLDECVEEILERLAGAKAPALMVGVEVRRFGLEEKVAALAERMGLPVVTSFMGRGLLAGAACPPVGTYLGAAGRPEITELVEQADALLLLGVIFSDTNFGVSTRQIDLRHAIHALGREVRIGYHLYDDVPLAALVERLLERAGPASVCPAAPGLATEYPRGLVADGGAITPQDIACAVNDQMAEAGPMPIASDIGDCLFTAMDIAHNELVAPGYYAGMGFGVPAGLGLQVASGGRPLILVGDGAFQMTGWELGNCRRYGWDPIVLVFNNCSWEMLRVFQPESTFNDLDDWHFADIARSLGGDGVRVTTRAELRDALARAWSTRGCFQLIEIMMERGALSATLSRFVEGIKKGRSG